MTRYVVINQRHGHFPICHYLSVKEAAKRIVADGKQDAWTIVAQSANRITASTPYRGLTDEEWRVAGRLGVHRPYDPWASQILRAPREEDADRG